jgi:hypothetical protein
VKFTPLAPHYLTNTYKSIPLINYIQPITGKLLPPALTVLRFDTYMDSPSIARQNFPKLMLSTEIEIANIYSVS